MSCEVVSSNGFFGMAVPGIVDEDVDPPKSLRLFVVELTAAASGLRPPELRWFPPGAFDLLDDRRGRVGTFSIGNGHARAVCEPERFAASSADAAWAASNKLQSFRFRFLGFGFSCFSKLLFWRRDRCTD